MRRELYEEGDIVEFNKYCDNEDYQQDRRWYVVDEFDNDDDEYVYIKLKNPEERLKTDDDDTLNVKVNDLIPVNRRPEECFPGDIVRGKDDGNLYRVFLIDYRDSEDIFVAPVDSKNHDYDGHWADSKNYEKPEYAKKKKYDDSAASKMSAWLKGS